MPDDITIWRYRRLLHLEHPPTQPADRHSRLYLDERSDGVGEQSSAWKESLAWDGARRRRRYSEEHKETLEFVSSEALRMREIKDDLTAVLQRLRQGDVLPKATVDVVLPTASMLPQSAVEKGTAEEEELARAFYGAGPRGDEEMNRKPKRVSCLEYAIDGHLLLLSKGVRMNMQFPCIPRISCRLLGVFSSLLKKATNQEAEQINLNGNCRCVRSCRSTRRIPASLLSVWKHSGMHTAMV